MRTFLRIAVALEAIAREMQKFNEPASAQPAPVSTPVKDEQKPTAPIEIQARKGGRPSAVITRKGHRWSEEEDAILLKYLQGNKTYTQISKYLPGRTPDAISERVKRLKAWGIIVVA